MMMMLMMMMMMMMMALMITKIIFTFQVATAARKHTDPSSSARR
jgi:hypothetical protein